MVTFNRWSLLCCLAVALAGVHCYAAQPIAGEPIVFNDNGGWSWFEGERVVVDLSHGKVLISSVANGEGAAGASRAGDIDVASYDLAARTSQRFTLSKRLQEDDHDSAALLVLPDGRYLASYSKHSADNRLRWRVSTQPGDITAWQDESSYVSAGGTTYSNLCYLSKPEMIFDFHRDRGRGFDPNYLVWKWGDAASFRYGGHLLTGPEGNTGFLDRPYLRYAGNGVDRIHFITSDHHPRNLTSNSIYHGYIEFGRDGFTVDRSDGTALGALSTTSTSPYKASDFTVLLRGDAVSPANDLRMTRAWPTDIKLDAAGKPYVLFTARVDDRDVDHRFFYGRYVHGEWSIHELAAAGDFLYKGENDYTGLGTLDPNDPDHVFVSTTIDPRNRKVLAHYEIFEGETPDEGLTWRWLPITFASSADNLRPVAVRGARGSLLLVWMRGKYNSYTSYNTSIVGLVKLASNEGFARAPHP